MLKIAEISLPLDGGEEELRRLAVKRLRVPPEHIVKLELVKKSVDARKKADQSTSSPSRAISCWRRWRAQSASLRR